MEKIRFEFCGIGTELRVQRPVQMERDLEQFIRPEGQVDVVLTCKTGEISRQGGVLLDRNQERAVYRRGEKIERCPVAGGRPYAILSYEASGTGDAELLVREGEWDWVTRGLQLWITAGFPILLLRFRSLLLHASYIRTEEGGILFTAPSQTGKSTQAELWRRYRGAEIINGDKAGLSLRGTPEAHGVPFSGTSGICKNVSLPLRAVVVLSQAQENKICRLRPSQVVSALIGNIFIDRTVPEEWSAAIGLLLDLAEQVPVYSLACTPDKRAVETLETALKSEGKRV